MIKKCSMCGQLFLKEHVDDYGTCEKCALKRLGLKHCNLCGTTKPLECFRILKKSGFTRSYCKACENQMIYNGRAKRKAK